MRDGGRVLLAQALSTVIVYDPRSHGWGVGAPAPRRFYPSFLRPWMGAQKKGAKEFFNRLRPSLENPASNISTILGSRLCRDPTINA